MAAATTNQVILSIDPRLVPRKQDLSRASDGVFYYQPTIPHLPHPHAGTRCAKAPCSSLTVRALVPSSSISDFPFEPVAAAYQGQNRVSMVIRDRFVAAYLTSVIAL